ncbi:hypothetical protein PHMEG_00022350 [Phytophthora megakarya]|uniref:Uncharacterized protein n=1 Tax=Phytophthora megakarya TaxID=4795 RepID=A0A225VKC5_9STRA|nr:hypothetical protein PHMEG_00022350 [Phytophthora megakarya]
MEELERVESAMTNYKTWGANVLQAEYRHLKATPLSLNKASYLGALRQALVVPETIQATDVVQDPFQEGMSDRRTVDCMFRLLNVRSLNPYIKVPIHSPAPRTHLSIAHSCLVIVAPCLHFRFCEIHRWKSLRAIRTTSTLEIFIIYFYIDRSSLQTRVMDDLDAHVEEVLGSTAADATKYVYQRALSDFFMWIFDNMERARRVECCSLESFVHLNLSLVYYREMAVHGAIG